MPTALINGARINYVQVESEESRDDLVMVHGLATSLAFWYFPYASIFARRYRVTVFDLRGHGRSEMTPGGYSPQAQAADLEGLMDHLGIDSAHFVAHSFGGVIALGLAKRAPARMDSLVLCDTQISATRHMPIEAWGHSALIQTMLDRHGIDLDAQSPFFGYELLTEVAKLLQRGQELHPDLVELVGPTLGKHPRKTALRWLDLVSRAEVELTHDDALTPEALRTMRFPTLALYGERSKACATRDLLRPVWPMASFTTIPNAGHFFPVSRSEEVIAACEAFWNDLELTTSTTHRVAV